MHARTHTHTRHSPLSPDWSPSLTLSLSACSSASPSWRRTPCQQWSSAHSQWLPGRRGRARKRATPKPRPSSNQRESPSLGTLMGSWWRSPMKCLSGLMLSVIITKKGNSSTNQVFYLLLTHLTLSYNSTLFGLQLLVLHIMTCLLILVKNSRLMSALKDLCQVEANNRDDITVMSSQGGWGGGVFSWWEFATLPVEATKSHSLPQTSQWAGGRRLTDRYRRTECLYVVRSGSIHGSSLCTERRWTRPSLPFPAAASESNRGLQDPPFVLGPGHIATVTGTSTVPSLGTQEKEMSNCHVVKINELFIHLKKSAFCKHGHAPSRLTSSLMRCLGSRGRMWGYEVTFINKTTAHVQSFIN